MDHMNRVGTATKMGKIHFLPWFDLPVWTWGTNLPLIFKIALKNYFTSIPSD